MGWRTLDLTHLHGELGFSKRTRMLQIVQYDTGEITEVAPCDINVIFAGVGVGIRAGVVEHLVNKDVAILFCDWKGCPLAGVYPWSDTHGRIAARQRSQAVLSLPRTKNAWMRIVRAKIRGQANNLDALGLNGSVHLREIASNVVSGDLTNCEANAARCYWHSLLGETFRRCPGLQTDRLNSMLDYGYTVLRGYCMRAVLAAGLAPALGLFHRGRGNSFALADDLIEPFRPVVDIEVARLKESEGIDNREVRRKLLNVATDEFDTGMGSVPAVMIDFAQQYGRYVESEIKYLPVPEWRANALHCDTDD